MTDIIIYGRGKTGVALQKMTNSLGIGSVFYDDERGFDEGGCFSENSVVVTSPGVKPAAKGMQLAKKNGATIVSELDFCFPYCESPCVSVTGTNGKTTTCQMIFHILAQAGKSARLLGNGGVPFSSEVLQTQPHEITVLESSSFQLANTQNFAPRISLLTNIAPDHLDYHGSLDEYIKAKRNNFCHQKGCDFAIFNADDPLALQVSADSPAFTLYYSVCNPNANCYYQNKVLHLNFNGQQVNYGYDLTYLPKHNLSNLLGAILACYLLGVSVNDSCKYAESYRFLPHRLQTVARINGVTFVDDSKATNVHATVSALQCFENVPLALILGGSDKGCAFDDVFLNVHTNVRAICAVGETSERIAETAQKYFVSVKKCADYKQAVEFCYRRMKNIGGVVLMSNACASFDLFSGYSERGDYFAKLVGELCRDEKKD